jgi:hypothetical protein
MSAKIRSRHLPARDKHAKGVLSDELLDLGIGLKHPTAERRARTNSQP